MAAVPPLIAVLRRDIRALLVSLLIGVLVWLLARYSYLVPIAILLLVASFGLVCGGLRSRLPAPPGEAAPSTLGCISHETLHAAMFREWIVNVGQRPAPARLAHVMIELRERLRIVGRVDGNNFEMPLTQEQIGEALGITAVHANRVIKQLRQDGIVELHRGSVTVLDERKFMELVDFDGRYLHQSPTL
ncbi:Crp/Fnr family transcriptional regulator [Bradyrhizobium sp. F1.4.3]|uniref:Crp/Fnr family transcriptional regulator n=1 Tax=Bradyrhizobium sp. F1.4.3 TaxID=3156356 RepID=UPI0033913217